MHYILFIVDIISAAKKVSQKMLDFIKNKLTDNTVYPAIKAELVKQLNTDPIYLKNILEQIKNNKIADEKDMLKDSILRILYPKHITSHEITNYLLLYNARVGGHCNFLYNTEYEDKYLSIDNIHKACFIKDRKPQLILPENVESFIHDYFLETLLKYKNGLSAKEIYNIIKHFRQYYADYEQIRFYSYRYAITDEVKVSKNKIMELTNELFSLYIDDLITTSNNNSYIFTFVYFYNYMKPNRQCEILFNKIKTSLSLEINQILFIAGLNCLPRDDHNKIIITDEVTDIVRQYGFEKILNNYLYPKKEEWQIKFEKQNADREVKQKEQITKNNVYFINKTDEEIQNSFGDLHYISRMVLYPYNIEKIISHDIYNRLKIILSNIIFKPLINPELLTIESLACNSPNANRNIDQVYYTACTINNFSYKQIDNKSFLQYLYIINLAYGRIINSIKNNFFDQIETEDGIFIINTLKQYINLITQHQLHDDMHIIMKYIKHESNIDKLKKIAMSYESDNESLYDNIIKNFLYVYNFDIKLLDLKSLSVYKENYMYYDIIHALILIHNNKSDGYKMNITLALYALLRNDNVKLTYLASDLQINIIDYMLNTFNTEESIEHINGFQSQKDMCASFLRHSALGVLSIENLQKLKQKHSCENDIWKNRINYTINELQQQSVDQEHQSYSIKKIKNYIFYDTITSIYDFYIDVTKKLNIIKTEIEDNRLNNKKAFYGNNDDKKIENDCRDEILRLLKNKYDKEIIATKEQSEAENFVDINIKYQNNTKYEVQIECKRDDNDSIYTSIQEQLIENYLSSSVQYGIYLIFYFGDKKNKDLLLKKVEQTIPEHYTNNIKIICIDLT